VLQWNSCDENGYGFVALQFCDPLFDDVVSLNLWYKMTLCIISHEWYCTDWRISSPLSGIYELFDCSVVMMVFEFVENGMNMLNS